MTKPPDALPPSDDEEADDEVKTADDSPAPTHTDIDREVLVRDAVGNDPYSPDGKSGADDLGVRPEDRPDPLVSTLQNNK